MTTTCRTVATLALLSLFTGCSGSSDAPGGDAPRTSAALPRAVWTDITTDSGIDYVHVSGAKGDYFLPEEMGPGGAFIDFDEDGDLDVYIVQSGEIGTDNASHRNRLYENDGGGRFTDVSAGSGADIPGYGMGCAAADADGDGDVDLYVTRLGPDVLLRNDGGGHFTDVTRTAGLGDPGFGASAAFLDYDRDGRLDLYVTRYVEWARELESACYDLSGLRDYCSPLQYEAPSVDRLYRGAGNGRFEDVTEQAGISTARGNGLGVVCSDFDMDGWVDVYVANDQTPAFLWRNRGDGTFIEDAGFSGCAFNANGIAIAGMGVVAEDLEGDGDTDVVVTNIHDQAHLCLENRGTSFADVSATRGFGGWGVPYTGFGIALFDQNNDMRWDGYIVNGAVNRLTQRTRGDHEYAEPDQFIRQNAEGRFVDASTELGAAGEPTEMGRSVLVGDIDNDGDPDLLVLNNRGPARLLRNDAPDTHAWTLLDLRSATGNTHAIGARVAVHTAGVTQQRELRPNVGYLSSYDPRLHFGLGPATIIDSLAVVWPDGRRDSWSGLPVRRILRLEAGNAPEFETLDGSAPSH